MGTRSRVDVNDRCTVRGGPRNHEIEEALHTMDEPGLYNRASRLRATAVIRTAAKRIRKRVPWAERRPWQQGVVSIAEAI